MMEYNTWFRKTKHVQLHICVTYLTLVVLSLFWKTLSKVYTKNTFSEIEQIFMGLYRGAMSTYGKPSKRTFSSNMSHNFR